MVSRLDDTGTLMQLKSKNGLSYWEFDLLKNEPQISHGSFLRKGGFSPAPYASLNVSFGLGDDDANIHANRNKICETLSLPHLLSARQCHGDTIHIIQHLNDPIPPCDALITQIPGAALLIQHADCQAALLYDPVRKVVGAVHAGWRGSVQQILTKTIGVLRKEFDCKPDNILVCISPSLGPENGEFVHYQTELPERFWPFQVKPCYFDFWEISRHELETAGILPHHIEIAKKCTKGSLEDYFSYRGEKVTGRLGTAIGLTI